MDDLDIETVTEIYISVNSTSAELSQTREALRCLSTSAGTTIEDLYRSLDMTSVMGRTFAAPFKRIWDAFHVDFDGAAQNPRAQAQWSTRDRLTWTHGLFWTPARFHMRLAFLLFLVIGLVSLTEKEQLTA